MSNSARTNLKNLNRLKKDTADKEMKEYAETAMNELLASTSFSPRNKRRHVTAVIAPSSDGSSSSSSEDSIGGINSASSSISPARRDGSVSPSNHGVYVPVGYATCGWCHKIGPTKCFTFKMANCDKVFCSEVCFTHYRRANFKRNKTCDWCRHVRHTVSYVDLQDGDSQYQFCSDKCLNQFKLDIFCQETKEHLEIHPHHQEQLQNMEGGSLATLITPDLWLKNCASPPSSDKSRSSTPINTLPSSPNSTLCVNPKNEELNPSPLEEPSKKRCKKYSNDSFKSTKKKKTKKLSSKSLCCTQTLKCDNTTNVPKSSQTPTESTPRVPFYPNFSSMLPAGISPSDYLHRPRYYQLISSSSNCSQSQLPSPSITRNSLGNLQIPPLLPITRTSQISNHNSSSRPTPSLLPPPPTTPVSTPTVQNSTNKPLLPPPTILVPYPIILPIPIPIPVPIPLPIFLNDPKKSDPKKDESHNVDIINEDTELSSSSSPDEKELPISSEEHEDKQRKKNCSNDDGKTLKHLVENY